jgi:Predicted membrane protein involved in D-alanine export
MAFVPIYILILFFTIIIDYIAGISIENASGGRRKWYLIVSLIANIGVLAYFKYYNFFIDNINDAFNTSLPLLKILLPIGLSFHTFQAMSYTIEVYRGNQKAEKHFGIYALYVMFYPQLVAGPIERPQNVLPQFHEKKHFSYDNLHIGLRLMLWGLFKKVVIADRLSVVVNEVYKDPTQHTGLPLLIAMIFFSFQIYCDFSGYSDIALGSAKVMGFNLMTNFNTPYSSKSISEFWKRWHISLSTWFKDYLYISLGGNRVALPRVYFNLFFVFMVSGFWHGANWTFIIWGALHGIYLIMGMLTKNLRGTIINRLKIDKVRWLDTSLNIICTYILVTLAWVFFRASTLNDATYVLTHFHTDLSQITSLAYIKKSLFVVGSANIIYGFFNVAIGLVLIGFLIISEYKKPIRLDWQPQSAGKFTLVRYCLLVFAILVFGVYDNQEFIYFQF